MCDLQGPYQMFGVLADFMLIGKEVVLCVYALVNSLAYIAGPLQLLQPEQVNSFGCSSFVRFSNN